MSQLPALPDGRTPVPIATDLDRALASISAAIDWGTGLLPADRAPLPALRERLAIRADVLANRLGPVGPTQARIMVAALLTVLPGQGSKGSGEDADRVQGLYVRALDGVPAFALRVACSNALMRGVGGKKFAPSPAELRAEAEREAHPWRVEAEKVRRVLDARIAPPPPDAETRKASAAAARHAFGIPAGGFSGDRPHRVDPQADSSLAKIAADITARSDATMARYREAVRERTEPPAGRFGEDAA